MELYVAEIKEHMHNIARYLKFYTLLVKNPLIKNNSIKALFDVITILFSVSKESLPPK